MTIVSSGRASSGNARKSGTNEAIGALSNLTYEVRIENFRQTVYVRINKAIFNDSLITAILEDSNNVFQFDAILFDNAAEEKRILCTISNCYITGQGSMAPDGKGNWVLSDIYCKGRDVIYP